MRTSAFIQYCIYLLLVTLLAFKVSLYLRDPWIVFTALAFAFVVKPAHWITRLAVILCAGLITTILLLALSFVFDFILLVLALISCTIACLSFAAYHPSYRTPSYLVNLLVIFATFYPLQVHHDDYYLSVILGASIAAILQVCFLKQNKAQLNWEKSMAHFQLLSDAIFNCFIDEAYADNTYRFELQIHKQKQAFLFYRNALQHDPNASPQAINLLDQLYQLTLDYSQLRWRVTDYTTFPLCRREMLTIQAELNRLYPLLTQTPIASINVQPFLNSVDQLENHYENVLQVAAREPYIFLLFIESLRQLGTLMETRYATI